MRHVVDLGVTAPRMMSCAQMGERGYYERAHREAEALIGQLRRLIGQEPAGAELSFGEYTHVFAAPVSVICNYDDEKPASHEYARTCSERCPQEWDEQARHELSLGSENRDK